MFSKILNDTVEVEIPSYVSEQSRQTGSTTNNANKFIPLSVSKDHYKFSFLSRTITDWNSLQGYVRLANNSSVLKDFLF